MKGPFAVSTSIDECGDVCDCIVDRGEGKAVVCTGMDPENNDANVICDLLNWKYGHAPLNAMQSQIVGDASS